MSHIRFSYIKEKESTCNKRIIKQCVNSRKCCCGVCQDTGERCREEGIYLIGDRWFCDLHNEICDPVLWRNIGIHAYEDILNRYVIITLNRIYNNYNRDEIRSLFELQNFFVKIQNKRTVLANNVAINNVFYNKPIAESMIMFYFVIKLSYRIREIRDNACFSRECSSDEEKKGHMHMVNLFKFFTRIIENAFTVNTLISVSIFDPKIDLFTSIDDVRVIVNYILYNENVFNESYRNHINMIYNRLIMAMNRYLNIINSLISRKVCEYNYHVTRHISEGINVNDMRLNEHNDNNVEMREKIISNLDFALRRLGDLEQETINLYDRYRTSECVIWLDAAFQENY